uniref:Uncharacterized protein n=1 Tax=Caenorhabditis japonica TaxID=281687 RepID=A0A8R1IBZ3_CAEJA
MHLWNLEKACDPDRYSLVSLVGAGAPVPTKDRLASSLCLRRREAAPILHEDQRRLSSFNGEDKRRAFRPDENDKRIPVRPDGAVQPCTSLVSLVGAGAPVPTKDRLASSLCLRRRQAAPILHEDQRRLSLTRKDGNRNSSPEGRGKTFPLYSMNEEQPLRPERREVPVPTERAKRTPTTPKQQGIHLSDLRNWNIPQPNLSEQ